MEAIKKPDKSYAMVSKLAFDLLNSATIIHIYHLSITGNGSYATRKALQHYYENIIDPLNELVEQYQCVSGKLITYPATAEIVKITSINDAIQYFTKLYTQIDMIYPNCSHTEILAILDDIKSLINKTKYKLTFLK